MTTTLPRAETSAADSPPRARGAGRDWRLPATLITAGLVVWAGGLRGVDALHAPGWGLAAVLPSTVWVGAALVVTGFVVSILVTHRHADPLRWAGLGATVLVLYGLQPLTAPLARTTTTWLHLGFIDRLATTGTAPDGIDARFSWPGWFAGWGLVQSTGESGILAGLAKPYPVIVAAVLALLTLGVADRLGLDGPPGTADATGGRYGRRAWAAALIVTVTNWIEQDYFSVQSCAHLAALAVIGLLLTGDADSRTGRAVAALRYAVVLLLVCGVVVSHQLTPGFLALHLAVLVAAAWRRPHRGPNRFAFVLIVLIAVESAWFTIGARAFWTGQLALLLDGFGEVGSTVSKNVGDRLAQGDPGLLAGRALRLSMTALLLAAAFAGAWLRRRRGMPGWFLLASLGTVSWLVVPAQSYGGELFMRCLLFSLPFLAMLTAELLVSADAPVPRNAPRPGRRLVGGTPRWRPLVATGLSVAAAFALITARGGNDGFTVFSAAEYDLSRRTVQQVPAGGSLFLPVEHGPVRTARVGSIRYQTPANTCPDLDRATACIARVMPDTVLITRSMTRWIALSRSTDGHAWLRETVARTQALGYRVRSWDSGGVALVRAEGRTTPVPPARPVPTPVGAVGAAMLTLLAVAVASGARGLATGRRFHWWAASGSVATMVALLAAQLMSAAHGG